MKLISGIIGVICGVLSYWLNPYNELHVNGISIYYIMGGLAFLSTILLGFIYKKKAFKTPVYFCMGFFFSVLVRIFFDISVDSSTHNLFPIEIAFVALVIIPSSFAGIFLIDFINRKEK